MCVLWKEAKVNLLARVCFALPSCLCFLRCASLFADSRPASPSTGNSQNRLHQFVTDQGPVVGGSGTETSRIGAKLRVSEAGDHYQPRSHPLCVHGPQNVKAGHNPHALVHDDCVEVA
jgi:hypothetical protein